MLACRFRIKQASCIKHQENQIMANCKNVGSVDRLIRGIIGAVSLVLAFTTLGVMTGAVGGIVAAVIGVVMLGTAALGICPLYIPFRMSTCKPSVR